MSRIGKEHFSHYAVRGVSLFDRSPDLRERFDSPSNAAYHKYIDTEAILYIRELQEVGVPFPPWKEMLAVGGETDLRKFLSIGYDCYASIRNQLEPKQGKNRILDFGVGCARTMRFFFRELDQFECYGCDVDRKAIAYLKDSVSFIEAAVIAPRPPLPYADKFFDSLYSISVFAHFTLELFSLWLREAHRVLKPGGILLMTLHGQSALSRLERDADMRKLMGFHEEQFAEKKYLYYNHGFAWMSHPVGSEDVDTSGYGISFIRRDYVDKLTGDRFEQIRYIDGAISRWQDLAVFRKRG
ncbi:MAG TPA: class I SAM-dependent methyltransferase [Candidatus Polarisedimenticolia bacterium]|nr:class I SAM-dependent methyltransferase [Candidatus Polarisedimenticolia bacterium]